jgi:anaerobic selenocysteine-containing dehydrogenase
LAALTGICKSLVGLEDEAGRDGARPVLDHAFISAHTHGFDQFAAWLRRQEWPELERRSGLSRASMEATAAVYARSKATMGIYG